jgi:hypothetical protein
LLLLPNVSLGLTWLCFVFAAFISWTEEELGEDGMELESGSDDDDKSSVQFKLKNSESDELNDPKYSIF